MWSALVWLDGRIVLLVHTNERTKGAFSLDAMQREATKCDVIDSLRKVATSRHFREQLLNFSKMKLLMNYWPVLSK